MSGTTYPLNLAEMCWKLGLRKPELIQNMYDENASLQLKVNKLTEELNRMKEETNDVVESVDDASEKNDS